MRSFSNLHFFIEGVVFSNKTPYMSIHDSTTKHPITLRLGILAYFELKSLSGVVAKSDEVVFKSSFFHREGSFSHTPPYMFIHNSTTKHPITLTLGILAYLDPTSLSGLVAESDEVVFESSLGWEASPRRRLGG